MLKVHECGLDISHRGLAVRCHIIIIRGRHLQGFTGCKRLVNLMCLGEGNDGLELVVVVGVRVEWEGSLGGCVV